MRLELTECKPDRECSRSGNSNGQDISAHERGGTVSSPLCALKPDGRDRVVAANISVEEGQEIGSREKHARNRVPGDFCIHYELRRRRAGPAAHAYTYTYADARRNSSGNVYAYSDGNRRDR